MTAQVVLRDGELFCPSCVQQVDIVETTRMVERLAYGSDLRIEDGIVKMDYTDGKTISNEIQSQTMECSKCGWSSDQIEIG